MLADGPVPGHQHGGGEGEDRSLVVSRLDRGPALVGIHQRWLCGAWRQQLVGRHRCFEAVECLGVLLMPEVLKKVCT